MKKSKLKQIIKEELKNILEAEDPIQTAFRSALNKSGTKLSKEPSSNKMALSLEQLPGYNELPEKQEDKTNKSILLPSIDDANASNQVFSKEAAQNWAETFKQKWDLNPGHTEIKFKLSKINQPEVVNSDKFTIFLAKSRKYISDFYDKLKYKGD